MVTGLRVAIDLDGTLADLSAAMYAVAARELPGLAATMAAGPGSLDDPDVPFEQPTLQQLALSSSQLDELWGRVLKIRNFWTTLEEM